MASKIEDPTEMAKALWPEEPGSKKELAEDALCRGVAADAIRARDEQIAAALEEEADYDESFGGGLAPVALRSFAARLRGAR